MSGQVYRILDANLNRLREALRVIEEFFRFILNDSAVSAELKILRHSLNEIEESLGRDKLLTNRDTSSDCFAAVNRPEELEREDESDILTAAFKRAQEAARVIEEYTKITPVTASSEKAKTIRFLLYQMEQTFWVAQKYGKEKK